MINKKITAFAKSYGYDGAVYRGKWNDYDVYEPIESGEEPANVGKPEFIFVSGDMVFMATDELAFQYIDSLPEE